MRVGGAHYEIRADPALAEKRVAADLAAFMVLFGIAEQLGDFAFRYPAPDLVRQQRRSAFQLPGQRVEHSGGDMRNACHDEDIAVPDARCARHLVGNQIRTVRHPRHSQTAGVYAAASFIICMQRRAGLWVDDHLYPQRRRDGINGDVVMRRADAAGREQIVVARPQGVDRLDNCILVIRHHPHFFQTNALDIQPQGNLADVFVLGAAGEDFIADNHKRGGVDAGFCHERGIAAKLGGR